MFFFKQKPAYEVRISDWSSDVCSSDLVVGGDGAPTHRAARHLTGAHPAADEPEHAADERPHDDEHDPAGFRQTADARALDERSDAHRVGKACVNTCRSRWSPIISKKKLYMISTIQESSVLKLS